MTYCSNCGKEVNGNFCPNCGNSINIEQSQPQQQITVQKNNTMAIVGFVVGCVSIFLNFWGIVGIISLVFSVVGLVQIGNGNGKGKGFAIAGIAIGGFSVLYGFITLLLLM